MGSVWEAADERHALPGIYKRVADEIGWDGAIEFGMRIWFEKRPPSSGKTGAFRRGTGFIYIPKAITECAGRELVRLAGTHHAALLVKAFGGENLEFPCIASAFEKRTFKAIAEQVADGWHIANVAFCFDYSERHIRRICAEAGVDMRAASVARRERDRFRQDGVRERVAAGESMEDVAYRYGYTLDAAQAICAGVRLRVPRWR